MNRLVRTEDKDATECNAIVGMVTITIVHCIASLSAGHLLSLMKCMNTKHL